MSDADIWLVIALLFLATLIARAGFWLGGHRMQLPPRLQEALRYAPACAMAAIIVPDLILVQGNTDFSLHNPKFLAGLGATAYFLVRKNMLETIIFGMAVLTVVRLYL